MTLSERDQKLGEKAIAEFLNYLGQKVEEKWSWDPAEVKWAQENGFRGPYEKAVPEGQATYDFKNMLADLKEYKGKLTGDGLFYWVFNDAGTVGRKKRERQQ